MPSQTKRYPEVMMLTLPRGMKERITIAAEERMAPATSLVRQWIKDGLEREEAK